MIGQPFLSVKDFGAVGNGSIDDTAALQAAITAAAIQGKTLLLPDGCYLITAALILPSAITIRGNGPYRSIIRNNSLTADYFTGIGLIFVTIAGLEFDSTVVRTGGALFNFRDVDHTRLENLRILDPYQAGNFTACDLTYLTDVYLVHGGRGFNRGFWFQSCTATYIDKLTSNMGIQKVAEPQLQFDSGCDTVAVSNTAIACQAGQGGQAEAVAFTHTLAPGSFAPRWVRMFNFYVESGSTEDGMRIDDTTSLYVTNGYFATSRRGVNIGAGTDIRFVSCLFVYNQQEGARLTATGPTDVVSFNGCTFSDNSQEATNTWDGANVSPITGSASFTDCYFGDTVVDAAKKQRYGISAPWARVSVTRPICNGNATGRIHRTS